MTKSNDKSAFAPWQRCLVSIAFLPGAVAFSRLTYSHVHHSLYTGPSFRVLPHLILAVILLACVVLPHTNGAHGQKYGRWTKSAAGLGLCAGAAQLFLRLQGPWLFYVWMACLAGVASLTGGIRGDLQIRRRVAFLVVALSLACACAMQFHMQWRLWGELSFGYHDIGLFARALYSAIHGRGLWVDSLNHSILGEHAFFAIWLLVPFCLIGLHPLVVLIAASAASLSGSASIAFWFAHRLWRSWGVGLTVAVAWLMLPMLGCLVIAHGYGFREVYLAVPLLMLGAAFGELGRFRSAAVAMMASLAREDVALTVAA